jgi:hypothetical protein
MRNFTKIATRAFALLAIRSRGVMAGMAAQDRRHRPWQRCFGTYSLTQVRTLGNLGGGGSGFGDVHDGRAMSSFLNGASPSARWPVRPGGASPLGNLATMTDYGTYSARRQRRQFEKLPWLSTASQAGNTMTANTAGGNLPR